MKCPESRTTPPANKERRASSRRPLKAKPKILP